MSQIVDVRTWPTWLKADCLADHDNSVACRPRAFYEKLSCYGEDCVVCE